MAKLGEKFLNNDDTLNRLALRKYAFENYEILKKLEEIIWPDMEQIIREEVAKHQDRKLIVLDCAVLFNAQLDGLVDRVLLIESDENLKLIGLAARWRFECWSQNFTEFTEKTPCFRQRSGLCYQE